MVTLSPLSLKILKNKKDPKRAAQTSTKTAAMTCLALGTSLESALHNRQMSTAVI